MMGWDEIIHPDLPKDGIAVQSWRSHKSLWDAARLGNKAILSSGYYLDHKRPSAFHYKVDPMKIEGGVTIDIDSTNWKGYQCRLFVQDTEIDGHLYVFGEGENLRGVMNFMDNASDFSNAQLEGETMTFSAETSFGTINYELTTKGDSIIGEASIAIFTIDVKGKQMGIQHKESGTEIVQTIVQEPYQEPLQTLVDVLQEDEFFNRMLIYQPQLFTTTPLDRIVDAARPESYVAYTFNKDVDAWLENGDAKAKQRIEGQLETWSENHEKLIPVFGLPEKYFEDSPISPPLVENDDLETYKRLKEIEPHSVNLSALSELALAALKVQSVETNNSEIDSLFIDAAKGHGGTLLPVEEGLKKLINTNKN